jgi:membrane-bound inhibitor of C-type lysozyme
MKRLTAFGCISFACTVLGSVALAATPGYTFTYRTAHYVCQGGQKLDVSYVQTGGQLARTGTSAATGPGFVLLSYRGQTYGLSQALSGSGARYASLYGPTPGDHGLEWWEHGGQGTLGNLTGKDMYGTTPLLQNCKKG